MKARQTNGRRHSPKCLCFGLAIFCTAALTASSRFWRLQTPDQVLHGSRAAAAAVSEVLPSQDSCLPACCIRSGKIEPTFCRFLCKFCGGTIRLNAAGNKLSQALAAHQAVAGVVLSPAADGAVLPHKASGAAGSLAASGSSNSPLTAAAQAAAHDVAEALPFLQFALDAKPQAVSGGSIENRSASTRQHAAEQAATTGEQLPQWLLRAVPPATAASSQVEAESDAVERQQPFAVAAAPSPETDLLLVERAAPQQDSAAAPGSEAESAEAAADALDRKYDALWRWAADVSGTVCLLHKTVGQ